MSTTTTVADRVYAVLSENDNGELLRVAQELCRDEREMDVADWALAFGLAFGIARGEDPYEKNRSVVIRAEAAAREAMMRWAGWTSAPSSVDAEVK